MPDVLLILLARVLGIAGVVLLAVSAVPALHQNYKRPQEAAVCPESNHNL